MKKPGNTEKNEIRFRICLGIAAVVYHVLIFVLPFAKTPVFYISWIFSLAALGAQIYVIRKAFFQGTERKSKFYGFPIARVGVMWMAAQLILSLIFMALAAIVPIWLPFLLYALLGAAAVIGLIAVDAVREEAERQEEKTERDTSRIRGFQAQAARLASENSIPELRELLQKLAEEFRYSDPVSCPALAEAETLLEEDLTALREALALSETEKARTLCRKAAADLAERNRLCRMKK